MTDSLKARYASSPLFGGNAPYIEQLYEAFLNDPDAVPRPWREHFERISDGAAGERAHGPIRDAAVRRAAQRPAAIAAARAPAHSEFEKQAAVSRLIQTWSLRGHQVADIDPLGLMERHTPRVLEPSHFGLTEADLDTEFSASGLADTAAGADMKLRDILALLERIYAGKIGADFAHVSRSKERLWLRERLESGLVSEYLADDEKRALLASLTRAEGIERYLHTRFVGQKRFSLEGGESLTPMIEDLIQQGGARGVREIIIGMAHRGRINVLVNVLGKSPEDLFSEFEGHYDPKAQPGSGDVKYHLGFSADVETPKDNVHVALAFNPSHLEIVDPVVEGSVRARQDRRGDKERNSVVPVLVHGDAAFAAQGVVMETLQMSQTHGFTTGGTIHIICNNQIGFTISDPLDARSTPYCSDVAKMIEAPVFHVNADDPEAALFVTRLALEYRQTFHKDVVIDLVCYRRHGHNEADEPAATQPVMYDVIRKHPPVRKLYADKLIEAGVMSEEDAQALGDAYRAGLDEGKLRTDKVISMVGNKYTVDWSVHREADWDKRVETGINAKDVARYAKAFTELPEGFKLHPRVARIVEDRRKMAAGEQPMDWGFAETMAYASLLNEGYGVRLTGQDTARGTFFHRHSELHDTETGAILVPLRHVGDEQASFTVVDSLLSEEAVVGFEYGFSTTDPDTLVIWEAQFGDFVNGAQVVIDQFISSGEAKWGRLSGLTLFLPHGYEGQGPEHSSARLERFLQLCAEHNMQVCVPSTPAQLFHMLRRQMLRPFRRPLIVMTPKSLLRHKLSASALETLTDGGFREVIGETEGLDANEVRRVVFCSGKVYFDLLQARETSQAEGVALVRIEQLYPFPIDDYAAVIEQYPKADEIIWCQEEPQNQGAWYQIRHRLQEPLAKRHTFEYAGRAQAAAPACGIYQLHERQQRALVAAALGVEADEVAAKRKQKSRQSRTNRKQA
ncbi:MAG: 2-oxoglutarate dehydrogenase E1 component [Gammaproteobacteria bacterium]